MSVNELLLILVSRRALVLKIFCAVLILALLLFFVMPRKYTAASSVVVDTKIDPITTNGSTPDVMASYMATQMDVINSIRVAQRVVKLVKLDQLPAMRESWQSKTDGQGDISIWIANDLLASRVTITSGKSKVAGNVINIAVKWSDAKTAAAIANAFAQAAIETNIELKIQPAKQFADWFAEHSLALHKTLEEKQKRLSDYENQSGVTTTDEKLDVENARLTELTTQLVAVQGDVQESQSKLRQVSAAGTNNESVEEVLQSPVIAKLKSDLSEAEAKEADLASTLGKNHPDYQSAAAEVVNIRGRLRAEITRITNGLANTVQINVHREAELRQALEAQKKRVLDFKHQHDQASVLESDVTTAQRDLDAVSERYAQTSLESQAQQSTSMVQLTVATPPFVPSSPKLVINLLVGIFMGGVLSILGAVFAERRDPRIRADDEVAEILGVPTLAKLDTVKVRRKTRFGKGFGELTRTEPGV